MIRARLVAAVFGVVLAVAPMPAIVMDSAEAQRRGSCTDGGRTGSGSFVDQAVRCSRGGDGKGQNVKNPDWITIKRYNNTTCLDSNGRSSIEGVVFNPATGQSYRTCLLRPATGATLVDATTLRINAPKPTANFGDKFLTGAEVTFTVPEMTSYIESLQQFPGATVTATPKLLEWDFGDGTKSNEISPKHTYLSKTIDPNNPNGSVVKVAVTGTWQVYLHPDNEGVDNPVQDLGEVTLTGELTRPIVEVWSAQTEPMN